MHRTATIAPGSDERLIDQPVAIPLLFVAVGLGQGHGLTHEAAEGIGLRQRLTVELVNPLRGAVG